MVFCYLDQLLSHQICPRKAYDFTLINQYLLNISADLNLSIISILYIHTNQKTISDFIKDLLNNQIIFEQKQQSLIFISMKLHEKSSIRGKQRAKKLGLTSQRFFQDHMSNHAKQSIEYVKMKDRPQIKLNQWSQQKFYKTDACQQLFNCPDEINREDISQLSLQSFIEKYEKLNKPVVLRGVINEWQDKSIWSFQGFYDHYKDIKFKIGEDQDGYKLRVPFKYYLEYLVYNKDDSPLYMFQSSLQSNKDMKSIIQHYKVPKYFRDDLFKITGEKRRPPYRWLLMGPQRSGTTIHIDPLYTSAWNTNIVGHKRWILIAQDLPKSIVKGKKFRYKGYKDEAINYFTQILPKIIEEEGREKLKVIEFIQYPGQTVYVPGGWWHAVINLDDTMALTQNVMTHVNFDRVWRSARCQRRKLSKYLLERLKVQEEELYNRAVELNKIDSYTMGSKYQKQSVSLSFEASSSSSSSSSEDSSSSSSEQSSSNSRSRSRQKKKQKKETKNSKKNKNSVGSKTQRS